VLFLLLLWLLLWLCCCCSNVEEEITRSLLWLPYRGLSTGVSVSPLRSPRDSV